MKRKLPAPSKHSAPFTAVRYSTRRYPGNHFFTWADYRIGKKWYDAGDPWPASRFPMGVLENAARWQIARRAKRNRLKMKAEEQSRTAPIESIRERAKRVIQAIERRNNRELA